MYITLYSPADTMIPTQRRLNVAQCYDIVKYMHWPNIEPGLEKCVSLLEAVRKLVDKGALTYPGFFHCRPPCV